MTLDDYARAYTFRAASLTMARFISPRLGWRVRNASNDMHRASSNPRVCMGGEVPPLPASPPTSVFVPIHEVAYTHDGSRDHGA